MVNGSGVGWLYPFHSRKEIRCAWIANRASITSYSGSLEAYYRISQEHVQFLAFRNELHYSHKCWVLQPSSSPRGLVPVPQARVAVSLDVNHNSTSQAFLIQPRFTVSHLFQTQLITEVEFYSSFLIAFLQSRLLFKFQWRRT